MHTNPLKRLSDFGQSVWNDNLSRDLIRSGGLQALIENDGIVGVTSNPSIFDAAISKSNDYDNQIISLVRDGREVPEIYDALTVQDIQEACDVLFPVFERTRQVDGYVSLEVSPHLAHDTAGTIAAVRRLQTLVDRPNLMIKIPGTVEGVPAIEQMLYEGVNINITLLFALDAYRNVMEAYLRAIERRLEEGKPVNGIHSVASFFVSRVDTESDSRLTKIIEENPDSERAQIASTLLGKIAIANARLAYQAFKDVFNSDRFGQLAGFGANIQRPLWASTSTKNPDYPDTLYVDELIGPNTVQTLAPASIEAFRDHGVVAATVESSDDTSLEQLELLSEIGVSYDDVVQTLVSEGVEAFARSFDSLFESLADKCQAVRRDIETERKRSAGELATATDSLIEQFRESGLAQRLSSLDSGIWSENSDVQAQISSSLGWLMVVDDMLQSADAGLFTYLANEVINRGYQRIILLGMGGSSLAPEVMASVLKPRSGFPVLDVLDTTNPVTVLRYAERAARERTLFIVSSKSGTTIETDSLFSFFYERSGKQGTNFIAVTDPGSQLEIKARSAGFWKVYTNRHDIGGRYSALSFFGLIPAAAAGIDVKALLQEARSLLPIHDEHHPGIWRGAIIGAAATSGRDKLTVVADKPWSAFGNWLEQLVAESTGKEGTGIVPLAGESPTASSLVAGERVYLVIESSAARAQQMASSHLDAGNPAIVEEASLGRLFLLWEIATAVAGQILQINPFDQPDVQSAKSATNTVLTGETHPAIEILEPATAISEAIRASREHDYIALMVYGDRTEQLETKLNSLRENVSAESGRPTTLGYGPRFLHSTGQLHKGGAPNGVFLQLIILPEHDAKIPGQTYSFGELIAAQSAGDFQALRDRELRVFRTELPDGSDAISSMLSSIAGVPAD